MTHANDKKLIKLNLLPGFNQDLLIESWPTWLQSCKPFIKKKQQPWAKLCSQAQSLYPVTEARIRAYFIENFHAQLLLNDDGTAPGKITGYFEPLVYASLKPSEKFAYPVHSKPKQITHQGLSREQIGLQADKLNNDVLLWVDDPYDLFFLHIQGSGLVELEDGKRLRLAYAGNNGHNYTSIGKILLKRKQLKKEQISMQSLKQWLIDHSAQAKQLMNQNQRYIFFTLSSNTNTATSGPHGSLNVPLTPQRSIAIDPKKILMGIPIWLDSSLPKPKQKIPFQRLVFAQDTGAAIKGRVRADVFFGQGKQAEYLAGHMNQVGRLFQLVPKVIQQGSH